jgi:hypothetical protein
MSSKDLNKSKLNKDTLKDGRKASIAITVESASSLEAKSKAKEAEKMRKKGTSSPVQISTASPSLSQGSGQTKPLPSQAGIQFESYEKSFTAKALSKDSQPHLVTWPKDDILVEDQKRKLRTSKPTLPVRATFRPCVFVTFCHVFSHSAFWPSCTPSTTTPT